MRIAQWLPTSIGVLTATVLVAGCGSGSATDGGGQAFRLPQFPAASHFRSGIDHPYLPLRPGARWVYSSKTPDGVERTVVVVDRQTRVVAGVTAVVVHDRAYLNGTLSEDTYDWFAQDDEGNVWYLGEDTTAYEAGEAPSAEGSWEAGVDGARAGLALPGTPLVGDRYQQEFSQGVAEDRGEIVALNGRGSVPWGAFHDAVRTRDTTPLEPDLVEFKYYVRDVGTVLEVEGDARVELLSFQPGQD
jgi:hypothetical protein